MWTSHPTDHEYLGDETSATRLADADQKMKTTLKSGFLIAFVAMTFAAKAGATESAVLREIWTGISGTAVSDIPTGTPPNVVDRLPNLESPPGYGEFYGVRLRAIITAPASGDYTFWVAGDDNCEVWLSTDDSPANKMLAFTVPGWTNLREWSKYSAQKSSPIPLAQGNRYYIEVLMKQDRAGDHVSVGWARPGESTTAPSEVVPSEVLSPINAGNPGDLDLSFDAGNSISGGDFPVLAIARQTDGKVIIGGDFTTVHGAVRSRIARLNADGNTDLAFLNGLAGFDGNVQCITVQPDGKILVGGWFLMANDVPRARLARLNLDGSLDAGFLSGMSGVTAGALTAVYAVALQPDGKILIAGDFRQVNGVARKGVARLLSDGSLDTTFGDPAVGGIVLSLALQPDGKVLLGGNFNSVSGTARIRLARLLPDGTLDTGFQQGLSGADNNVRAIAVQPDGRIVIGGDFTDVNGMTHYKVARLAPDGSIDATFQNPSSIIVPGAVGVSSVALQADGKVVLGGSFYYYNGVRGGPIRGGLARLNSDGTRDTTFDQATGPNNPVDALVLQPDGQVVVGGRFTAFDGTPRINVARVNGGDGALDTTFQNGPPGPDATVEALVAQPDGKVLIGGSFRFVNYQARRGIARLNADGSLDTSFQEGMGGVDSRVLALALQSDGKVIIGGNFGSVNGMARSGAARLNSDGSLDATYMSSRANGAVYALALQPDGNALIGGGFTSVGGVTRNRIARLLADGTVDPAFLQGLSGGNGDVWCMAVQPDGKVVIGGRFDTFNGSARGRIARLNPDGTLDTAFRNDLPGANGPVRALALQPDGKILVGGDFGVIDDITGRVARLNFDGRVDSGFMNRITRPDNAVTSIAIQGDGKILMGGFFEKVHGESRRSIARLNLDGSLDSTFGARDSEPNLGVWGANGPVFAVALDADERLLVGGQFTWINGQPRDRIARVFAGTTPQAPVDPSIHTALGTATLSMISDALHISNIGSSGADGVAIELNELSRMARLQFAPVNLVDAGAELAFSLSGMINDVPGRSFGKLSLLLNDGGLKLSMDPGLEPVASMTRMEIYNQDVLAGSTTLLASGVLGSLSGDVQLEAVLAGDAQPTGATWQMWQADFLVPVEFQPTGSAESFTGNRIRLLALDPAGIPQNLLRLEVTARNLDSLVVQEETAPQFEPRLRIGPAGQQLKLNWDTRSAVLMQAPTINGPWTRVLEGTNTVTLGNSGGDAFFRLVPLSELDPEFFASLRCSLDLPSVIPGYVCRRNILLIIADDVGVDQIPWYYGHYQTTDHKITVTETSTNPKTEMRTISQLANAGVTFLNAWSSPVCSPTRACLYTGNHSFRHGVYSPETDKAILPTTFKIYGIETDTTTIAKVLSDHGYSNGLFGKWHLGEDEGNGPVDFDWDRHYGALGGSLDDYFSWQKVEDDTKGGHNVIAPLTTDYATSVNTDDALNWITSQTGPWMATVAFNAPHDPWDDWPPDGCAYKDRTLASATESSRAKYRSMLECLDRSVGDLLAGIPTDVLEQTTIIFMGDNGTPMDTTATPPEPMSEHFTEKDKDGNYRVKDSPYEGGVNVPLIIADGYTYLHHGQESSWTKGRGRVVSPGRFETSLVQTLDIFATCREIGRATVSAGVDSVSMVPYLSSASASSQRDYIFAESRNDFGPTDTWTCKDAGWDVAIRDHQYKLIVKNYGSNDERYELYDLINDRWENTDLRIDGGVSKEEDIITQTLLDNVDALLATESAACSHP